MKKVLLVLGAIAAVAIVFQAGARHIYPLKFEGLILRQAARHDLEPALLAAIVYEESKFNRASRSEAGAVGLMQLMPSTAEWASKKLGRPELAADLIEPGANLVLGSWYFRRLLDRYHSVALALAAYNGGQRNLDRWLGENSGRGRDEVIDHIPFVETREFVRRVERSRKIYRWLYFELRR